MNNHSGDPSGNPRNALHLNNPTGILPSTASGIGLSLSQPTSTSTSTATATTTTSSSSSSSSQVPITITDINGSTTHPPPGHLPSLPSSPSELPKPIASGDAQQVGAGARLIVVANRLPVTISKDEKGSYQFSVASGGLVTALSGLKKEMSFIWVGWPGIEIPEEDQELVSRRLQEEHSCLPVYLSDELADRHYNGFCNQILWPLFHYHPREMNFDEDNWVAYREANLLFAEAVGQILQAGDMIWVHDYHLMILPMILRRKLIEPNNNNKNISIPGPPNEIEKLMKGMDKSDDRFLRLGDNNNTNKTTTTETAETARTTTRKISDNGTDPIKIGFFLHTPFPSSEIYRILPVRREILLGLLHCDLIGFHTYDYARHFLSACTRILSLPTMPNGVQLNGRYAHIGTFPVGIDPDKFIENVKKDSVRKRIEDLKERFRGCKVIVGVDRLDYIKGMPQKLHALEAFLEKYPEWIGKVIIVQVAVPSREDVEEYQDLRASVNELVGRINGRFGTADFVPIHFMHRSIGFDELTALYAVSDACLVTSTRDGMNLVSYEYIACQEDRCGVMILSEFAGAAHSLNGSLLVNPWNTEELAEAIHEALHWTESTRRANHKKLFNYVKRFSASFWGRSFIAELQKLQKFH